MNDTLELLEAIGQDASLRHASAEELTKVLEQAQASEGLTAAVTFGDRTKLSTELGQPECVPPQTTQAPAHEEEEEMPAEVPSPTAPSPK